MGRIDFIELANFCVNRYKESFEGKTSQYVSTLFVKISEDNGVSTSTTPHILTNAAKCILIHTSYEKAVSNWYSWYTIEVINDKGEVFYNKLDDEFGIFIRACGSYSNQCISLETAGNNYYSRPWLSTDIKKIWDLYLQLSATKNNEERKLIARLYNDNEEIIELKSKNEDLEFQNELLMKEKEMYKDLLDQISELVSNKQ